MFAGFLRRGVFADGLLGTPPDLSTRPKDQELFWSYGMIKTHTAYRICSINPGWNHGETED